MYVVQVNDGVIDTVNCLEGLLLAILDALGEGLEFRVFEDELVLRQPILLLPTLIAIQIGLLDFWGQISPLSGSNRSYLGNRLLGVLR